MPVQLPEVPTTAQALLTAKQPFERLMPFANVEVAFEVERMLPPERTRPFDEEIPFVERPPEKEEVAAPVTEKDPIESVPVAVMLAAKISPEKSPSP